MNKQGKGVRWSKSGRSIFERFAVGLQEFTKTGEYPSNGNQDVKYCLELQKKRLDDKALRMEYEMTPRGHFADGGGIGRSWSDERYTSTMEYRTCRIKKEFYRNEKRLYRKERDFIFYQIVTNAHNMDLVSKDLYTCPNCGAVSQVETLQKGCPYCGTFFKVSELFPKVTNFFFVEDSGGTGDEIKKSVLKVVLPFIFVSIIGYSLYFFKSAENGSMISALISGIFGGIIFGGIVGYMVWAFGKLIHIFSGAAKAMPMLIDKAGSEKRFENRMKQYSPEFSYEYFSAKVVSNLKMIIFSEDAKKLPIYVGSPLGDMTSSIVEASYTGATALRQFEMNGNICQVTVAVYMEDIYDENGKIRKEDDTFLVTLQKDISKPMDYHFSIKKIHCKSCGDSFDATKQRECPSCGRLYEIDDEDWIVVKMKKV